MRGLSEVVLALGEGAAVAEQAHVGASGLRIDRLEVEAPIETRSLRADLQASLPRGRLSTGFDLPHGRIRVVFEPREP